VLTQQRALGMSDVVGWGGVGWGSVLTQQRALGMSDVMGWGGMGLGVDSAAGPGNV
jgi:hypothetical protein